MKKFGKDLKRATISLTIVIGMLLVLASTPAYATAVTLIKEHHPTSTFKDPTQTYDGYTPGANILFHVHLNVTTVTGGPILSIKNLNFTDTLPVGLTYVTGSATSTPSSVFTPSGQTLFWDFGAGPFTTVQADGYQATAMFNATVDSNVADNTFLTNQVTARYRETVSNALSQPTTSDTIWVARPVLDITKTNPAKAENGDTFNNTITLTNTGHEDAVGVIVTDNMPSGSTNLGATATSGSFTTNTATQVVWTGTIKNLTSGANTVTITIPTKVNTAASSVTNTASYTLVPSDTTFTHTSASCTTTVIHPAISLTKTASAAKVESGSSVTYTYNVTNTGDTSLTVSLVDDQFGTIFTGKVLAAGAFNVTTITKTLTTTTTNMATATGVDQTGASVTAQASATVTVIHPAISLTKTASPNTPQTAPATFVYTYVVTNIGDVTLSGVTVYDQTFNVLILGPVTLNPTQSATGTYSKTYASAGTFTDVANTTGTDQLGTKVTAFANATVVVTPPPANTTRTWGFWAQHTNFTEFIFDTKLNDLIQIDSGTSHAKTINTYAILFGAFDSIPAKTSTGIKRSTIDNNRITLLHQMLAAILNNAAFGTPIPIDPVTGKDLVTAANIAYSGNSAAEITRISGLLDTFNNSGDNVPFPSGLPFQGPATPQLSEDLADVAFWDVL